MTTQPQPPQSSDSLVERVARAIYDFNPGLKVRGGALVPLSWDDAQPEWRQMTVNQARAAIAASTDTTARVYRDALERYREAIVILNDAILAYPGSLTAIQANALSIGRNALEHDAAQELK